MILFGSVGCSDWQDVQMGFLGHGELMLVETEEDWFLGTVEVTGEALVVRSGFVGRPVVVPHDEVVRVVLASELDLE
jgi:hypothetical protein